VALSADDKRQGIYVRVDEVEIEANTVRRVYLEGVSFPLLLAKQVFHNKDGSIGVLYLVTSDLTLTYESGPPLGHGIISLYQKRWTKVALSTPSRGCRGRAARFRRAARKWPF